MKKIMGTPLSKAEQKSITGGGGGISVPGPGGMFVMVQCSNGIAVCIYCETAEECAANAEKACAAIGGTDS